MSERVIIIGGPRRGKSTLARKLRAAGIPTFCGDPRSKVKEPDDDVTYLPEGIPFAGEEGAAQWIVRNWLTLPGPWVIEGWIMARVLRRWPVTSGAPADKIVVLTRAMATCSSGQEAMHKGVMTVWGEARKRFAPITDESAGAMLATEARCSAPPPPA